MEVRGFASGPYQTNCYIAYDAVEATQVTVIDPGMHTADKLVAYLEEHGQVLEQIILTHGHIDHTRDAGTLAARFRVPVYIHTADEFMLDNGDGVSEESKRLFDAAHMTPIKDVRYLNDGESIAIAGSEFLVRHTPGHSPGSVVFYGEGICFSGDVLFKGSIGRTDLPQSNPSDMVRSLREVILQLDDSLQVLPGHGDITTIRAECMTNPFLLNLKG